MAHATHTRSASFAAVTAFNIASRVSRIAQLLSDWNSKRATVDALSKLSARELRDIGLYSCDLNSLPPRF